MMLSVWPMADRAAIEDRIASGMEVAIISVERQLPRNSRIIRLVSAAAITPSLTTPEMAALHENRLVGEQGDLAARAAGSPSAAAAAP